MKSFIARLLWKLFQSSLLREQQKALTKEHGMKDLEYAFVDDIDRKYYRYTSEMAMPLKRVSQMKVFLMWLSSGLSGEQLDELMTECEKQLEARVEGSKNIAVIGAIIQDIKRRKDRVVPIDLFCQILAIQFIREDENPLIYDSRIQQEKAEYIQKAADNEDAFFLQLPELKELGKLWNWKTTDWLTLLEYMKIEKLRVRETIRYYQNLSKSRK